MLSAGVRVVTVGRLVRGVWDVRAVWGVREEWDGTQVVEDETVLLVVVSFLLAPFLPLIVDVSFPRVLSLLSIVSLVAIEVLLRVADV